MEDNWDLDRSERFSSAFGDVLQVLLAQLFSFESLQVERIDTHASPFS